MEKNVLKIAVICTSAVKYFLYFCSVMICIGTVLIILFKDRIVGMLEAEDIVMLVGKSVDFPLIIWTCLNALAVFICISISVSRFQRILKNFTNNEYFSEDNYKCSKEILIAVVILTICQISARVSFSYIHIDDVSMIYDLSVKDYLLNMFFGMTAFISTILFKNGKILKDDSESII